VRIAWIVYGDLAQATGGYIYDRLVVEGLRAHGAEVRIVEPLATTEACGRAEVLLGDALCVRELGPLFEAVARPVSRVLLVHHLPSWEIERSDRERTRQHEARALAASDHVIATSDATRRRLMDEGLAGEHVGLPIDVVEPGADRLPRVARAPSAGGRIELLFVGSLVARKRVALLLDALESVPAPLPGLTLLGDPDREPAYARAIADRIRASVALRSSVTIAGVAGDDALARWLARADALVLPSSLEGYGMVLTEALHAGLPVIAARPAAIAAAIAHHGAVRVFDDSRDLAQVLRRFVVEPELRAAMRAEAVAAHLPTWAGAIDAFRRVLVVARRRTPPREGREGREGP
jgi:glycosyltransferase involved in cell wall biosynthesis